MAGTLLLSGATTFTGGARTIIVSNALINNTSAAVTNGLVELSDAVTGAGRMIVSAGAKLEVDAKVSATQTHIRRRKR